METQLTETTTQVSGTDTSKKHALCYESTAMEILGLTRNGFRKLGIQPTKVVPNPHWQGGPRSYLFNRDYIESLKDNPAVLNLQPKPTRTFDYGAKLIRKYGSPENAVLDAAQAMFSLNRYCKHFQCSNNNRSEIYELKNQFIKKLYLKGYCKSTHIHVKELEELVCHRCNGTGEARHYDYDGDDLFMKECPKLGRPKMASEVRFQCSGFGPQSALDSLCPPLYDNLDFISHNPGGKCNGQNTHPWWHRRRISLGRCAMSPETRYKRSRDNWKQKAACRAEKNRYQSKELARVKAERDRFKKELKEVRARAHQLESQSRVVLIQSKVDLVFLALQLFVVARIGFRAVSRVLGIVMGAMGFKKNPLSTDHHQLGDQALAGAHPICPDGTRAAGDEGTVL